MNWNETRRKLLQLAARQSERRGLEDSPWRLRGPVESAGSACLDATDAALGASSGALVARDACAERRRDESIGRDVRAASLCIASGKGGTGKTCVTASLASLFSARGRTLLVDADLGIGNAHILQNASPQQTLVDVVEGRTTMREIVSPCPEGVDLVAAGSGVPRMAELSSFELHLIASGLEELETAYRYVLVDSAAGVSRQTLAFAQACDVTLVVTTPDLTAMTDAYAILKVLLARGARRPLLLVNRARSEDEAEAVTDRILRVCERFVGSAPHPIGWLPEDPAVGECVNRRGCVTRLEPDAPASCALRGRAVEILEELGAVHAEGIGRRLRRGAGYAARLA